MPFESLEKKKEEKEIFSNEDYIQKQIDVLTKKSGYTHEVVDKGKEKIVSPEGEELFVRTLRDQNDPAVEKIYEMIVEEFGEEEAETLEWLKKSIEKELNDYILVEKENGEILGLMSSQYLSLEKRPEDSEESPRETFLSVWYVLTTEESRGKGIGKEIYRKLYGDALERARSQKDKIRGIIGEAVEDVELFLNKMGRKRIYFKNNQEEICEVPYFCPPVDMDSETGEPLEDPYPEHLMLKLFEEGDGVKVDDLLRMIKSIYEEYVGQEEDYKSREAYDNARKNIMRLLNDLNEKLKEAENGKCFLMNQEERRKIEVKNWKD